MKERTAIAVIQIFLYIPVFILGLILTFRNGFSKKAGWLYMVLLSICAYFVIYRVCCACSWGLTHQLCLSPGLSQSPGSTVVHPT